MKTIHRKIYKSNQISMYHIKILKISCHDIDKNKILRRRELGWLYLNR